MGIFCKNGETKHMSILSNLRSMHLPGLSFVELRGSSRHEEGLKECEACLNIRKSLNRGDCQTKYFIEYLREMVSEKSQKHTSLSV